MAEENKNKVEVEEEDEDLDIDDLDDLDELDEDTESEDEEGEKESEENVEEEDEEKKSKEQQDKEERARQARLRREREAKEREKREKAIKDEAYLKGQLEATKVNAYTNEPIEDEYDLKIYNVQKQLESEGKDPISDLPKRLAELNRNASKEAESKEKAKKEQDEAIEKDISDFKTKYPKTNLNELLNDPDFKDYSDGRLGIKGGKSLAQLYEDFERFKSKFVKREEEEGAKKKAPPSPNGGRKTRDTSYSDMSEEEKIKELKRQGLIN